MNKTGIEWCDVTWNPGHGCTQISRGCGNCYAKELAEGRLAGRGSYDAVCPFRVTWCPEKLNEPLKVKKGKKVFVWSMGDIFHREVPTDYIHKVFDIMEKAKHHTFFVLTKRSERMALFTTFYLGNTIPNNVWLGVSVHDQDSLLRASDYIELLPDENLFLSCEPLLDSVSLTGLSSKAFNKIGWVIVGGESGSNARPCKPEWVRSTKEGCRQRDIPFFFKGWGKHIPAGQWKGMLGGLFYHEYPDFIGGLR